MTTKRKKPGCMKSGKTEFLLTSIYWSSPVLGIGKEWPCLASGTTGTWTELAHLQKLLVAWCVSSFFALFVSDFSFFSRKRTFSGTNGVKGEGWVVSSPGINQSGDHCILEPSQSLQTNKIYQALCGSLTRNSFRLYSIDFMFLIEITHCPFESNNVGIEQSRKWVDLMTLRLSPYIFNSLYGTSTESIVSGFFSGRNYFSGTHV